MSKTNILANKYYMEGTEEERIEVKETEEEEIQDRILNYSKYSYYSVKWIGPAGFVNYHFDEKPIDLASYTGSTGIRFIHDGKSDRYIIADLGIDERIIGPAQSYLECFNKIINIAEAAINNTEELNYLAYWTTPTIRVECCLQNIKILRYIEEM
jgi:hypothetical protein